MGYKYNALKGALHNGIIGLKLLMKYQKLHESNQLISLCRSLQESARRGDPLPHHTKVLSPVFSQNCSTLQQIQFLGGDIHKIGYQQSLLSMSPHAASDLSWNLVILQANQIPLAEDWSNNTGE